MPRFTDENVPVECQDCEAYCEGLTDLMCHMLESHAEQYNPANVHDFAQAWIESAHIEQEEMQANYIEERNLDRAINADMEHKKHDL